MSSRTGSRIALFLLLFAIGVVTTGAANARPIRWTFMIVAGNVAGADAGSGGTKMACFPDDIQRGFITRIHANGEKEFADIFLNDNEKIRPATFNVVPPPNLVDCIPTTVPPQTHNEQVCVTFALDLRMGRSSCEGVWNLLVQTNQ